MWWLISKAGAGIKKLRYGPKPLNCFQLITEVLRPHSDENPDC